ncbi:MAG: xanthine dehydrogenase family protein molybdopterin-binding subunit, partial [Chloroflexi bacterium]|nr:xanthine dehydrogenase family protein molybdopterin-binding subunit [Chloroflexota bacterium]
FGAHFVDLEVDTATGEIFVHKLVAVHDVGRVVNPMGARSQMVGGILQGLGFALMEERVLDAVTGRMANANLETYKMMTAADLPEIVVELLDIPDDRANNLGAKGLGEPPIIPVAAAVANALANATGVRVRQAPLTSERVLTALSQASS